MHRNWQRLQDEVGKWADSVFGDRNGDISGICVHLIEEVREIHQDPGDIYEFADAIMLIIDAARIRSFTMEQLYTAVEDKLEINKRREWEHHEDGLIRHKKEYNC